MRKMWIFCLVLKHPSWHGLVKAICVNLQLPKLCFWPMLLWWIYTFQWWNTIMLIQWPALWLLASSQRVCGLKSERVCCERRLKRKPFEEEIGWSIWPPRFILSFAHSRNGIYMRYVGLWIYHGTRCVSAALIQDVFERCRKRDWWSVPGHEDFKQVTEISKHGSLNHLKASYNHHKSWWNHII